VTIHAYAGKVQRVSSRWDTVTVNLDLGFDISFRADLRIEGVDMSKVPHVWSEQAKHCMVILLGGKRVYAFLSETDQPKGRPALARVYLADRAIEPPPEILSTPPGFGSPMVEAGLFSDWIADKGCDPQDVRDMLNGTG